MTSFAAYQIRGIPGGSPTAASQLRSLVERIERLEGELKAINEDKRDVYAEAKAMGFDTKVLKHVVRQRRVEPAERAEFDEIADLYMHALGMLPGGDREAGESGETDKGAAPAISVTLNADKPAKRNASRARAREGTETPAGVAAD
ncbi:MAG: DUF2312 domain-containing protein [Flavobacteriaceae bacterium]